MNFQCSRTNKRINCLVYVKAFDRIIMQNISGRVFEVFISAVNITTTVVFPVYTLVSFEDSTQLKTRATCYNSIEALYQFAQLFEENTNSK